MYLLFFAVLNYLSYKYSNVSIRKVVSTYKLGDIQAMPHPAVSPCAIEPVCHFFNRQELNDVLSLQKVLYLCDMAYA